MERKPINVTMGDAAKENAKENDQCEDDDALEAALIAKYIVASSPHSKHADRAISLEVLSQCYDKEDYIKLCSAKSHFVLLLEIHLCHLRSMVMTMTTRMLSIHRLKLD